MVSKLPCIYLPHAPTPLQAEFNRVTLTVDPQGMIVGPAQGNVDMLSLDRDVRLGWARVGGRALRHDRQLSRMGHTGAGWLLHGPHK